MSIDIFKEIGKSNAIMDKALDARLKTDEPIISILLDAEHYSVMSGGKRVRPFLTLEFCHLFGGKTDAALPFAMAVEVIHSSSLIHDDLPCMDDDDMRRGKPSCHIAFGEANALLAGDSLLLYAFELCAENNEVAPSTALEAISVLAKSTGNFGMVGGQVIDLYGDTHTLDFDTLIKLHSLKTGALIGAAVKLGCLAAGVASYSEEYANAALYAKNIGLTFQIIDDILDARAGEEAPEKTTFLKFMSESEAFEYAKDLTDKAIEAIKKYEGSEVLIAFAEYLLNRDK